MDAYDCILTRRSIREFTNEEVSEELVKKIITAGMYAPSAGDQKPWHFIIIRKRETLLKITNFHPHSQMLKEANLSIAVVADTNLEKHKGYFVQDCAAATQNILLAIHSLGLGGVWIGIYPREERMAKISGLLKLPENIVPISLVAIGYPASKPLQPNRYDPTRIHYEVF